MQETALLEEISLLLRKEHERLEARLDGRWAQQEELLRQLGQYLAHQSPAGMTCSNDIPVPFSAKDVFTQRDSTQMSWSHGKDVKDDRKSFEAKSFTQVVPANDSLRTSEGTLVLEPANGEALDKFDDKFMTLTNITPANNQKLLSPRHHGSLASRMSYVGAKKKGMDTASSRASVMSTQLFLREVAVKLGTTSTERVTRDLEDQFRRLSPDHRTLSFQRIMDIIKHEEDSDLLLEEDVIAAVFAMVAGHHDIAPRDAFTNAFELNMDAFLHLMLADEIPPQVEQDVLYIRKAFEHEKLQRQDKLNTIATDRTMNKGGYEDLPVLADTIGASVILINALTIGLNSDIAPDHYMWRVLEYCFLAFFTAEVCCHMYRQGVQKFFFGRDWRWNLFDFVLVGFAVVDSTLSEINAANAKQDGNSKQGGPLQLMSRTMRLARLSRLVRLLRFKIFAELKQMIYGVVAGIRVLAWAILLLIGFIYMVSLVVRQTIGDDAESKYYASFEDVPWTMFTVFRCFTDGCTGGDGTPLQVYLYYRYGFVFALVYVVVFLFVSIGIFNLIMATFIDNVMAVSAVRKQVERAVNAGRLKIKLTAIVVQFWNSDQDTLRKFKTFGPFSEVKEREVMSCLQDVRVTREMLQLWMCHPDMISILEQLEIVNADHSRLFDALDCDLSGELEGSELVQGLMALRGPTEKIDVVSTMLTVKYMTAMLQRVESFVCAPQINDRRMTLHDKTSICSTDAMTAVTSQLWTPGGCPAINIPEEIT